MLTRSDSYALGSLPHQHTQFFYVLLPLIFLLLLPLLGTWLSGQPILPFLTFPPRPSHVNPVEVSWVLFSTGALSIALTIVPFLLRFLSSPQQLSVVKKQYPFPVWGWLALTCLIFFWVIAWTRFAWMRSFQFHTFTPLWLSYIALVNALSMKRSGCCLMLDQPKSFFCLFPLSAGFWWTFEYLNRFVHNWYYLPVREFDGFTYFLLGSICFSTVLPAIYGTYELLLSFQRINEPFKAWRKLSLYQVKGLKWIFFLSASFGLASIGFRPTLLYPLIWVSPLLLLLGLQIILGQDAMIGKLRQGDWSSIVTAGLAGLICGFLWELWNFQSLAHWEYAIPYLHVFQIFEMPILGYAGYLPFGLECLVFIQLCIPSVFLNENKTYAVNSVNLRVA